MFRKHSGRRSTNPLFVIFRLILSLLMFALLLGGAYSAYKHFSGLDPLKLDPQSVLKGVTGARTPQQFLAVLSSLKLPQNQKVLGDVSSTSNPSQPITNASFRFFLIADSHNDNNNLQKALAQARQTYPDLAFIIGLGDYTNVGTIEEFKSVKQVLDKASLRYFLIAGDHDMWDSRDKGQDPTSNFRTIFGPLYQSFTFNNFKFLLLDNSDNYIGISKDQQSWITNELEKAKTETNLGIFVFIHEPFFHPSSDHFMGRVEKELKTQAQSLIFQLKQAGVKKTFSGDIHYFSEYEEPVTKLPMVTVGAVVTERNPQAPRFAVVSVAEDGSTKVEDVEIK